MKLFLVLLLVSASVADRIDDKEEKDDEHDKYQIIPGYNIPEANQEFQEQDRDIYRPCNFYDLLCIRRYLSRHSKCKIAIGSVPDPLYRAQSTTYYPTFNVSVIQNEIFIGNANGFIREFYINRKDKLTILEVEFRNVTLRATSVSFRFHRRGQEPAITNTTTDNEDHFSFSTTTVFRGEDHLDLADSETVVYVNTLPALMVGPEAGVHEDPTIPARFAEFMANPALVIQEGFLTAAPFFAGTYIQYVLCDFGLLLK